MAADGPSRTPDPRFKGEVPSETLVFREFEGVNVASPRQSIGDTQFGWIENVMPLAHGNMPTVNAPLATSVTYTSASVFSVETTVNGVDWLFNFFADGSASYLYGSAANFEAGTPGTVAAAGTFSAPFAVPYTATNGNSGILIIDPTKGYWDWGVTTASTLTFLGNSLSSVTIGSTSPTTAPATITMTLTGTGTGALVSSTYAVVRATVSAAGAGYAVGDVLQFTPSGPQTTAAVVVVASVTAGAITGITLSQGGAYPGPTSASGATATGPSSTMLGGSGTGATITPFIQLSSYTVTNAGSGFTGTPTVVDKVGGTTIDSGTFTPSGTINGTSLAVYAGRVWIANNKVISFTDISSYSSFGGAGGSTTINDSYLHGAITALYAANGYLYIFGPESIDALSSVQISSLGITSFSRTNITASVGTTYQLSVQPYYRSLLFASQYGIYSLSGATPQKISDHLDNLFNPGTFVSGIVGQQVTLYGKLCMAFTIRVVDSFTTLYGVQTTRTLVAIFFERKWFFVYPGVDVATLVSAASGSTQVLYGLTTGGTPRMYRFFAQAGAQIGFIQTKLWDAGQPIADKEVLRVGVGAINSVAGAPGLTITSDNEYTKTPVPKIGATVNAAVLTFVNNNSGALNFVNNTGGVLVFTSNVGAYTFSQGAAATMGGKYFGLSLTLTQTGLNLPMLAMEYRTTRVW